MNERVTIYNYKLAEQHSEADFLACSAKVDQIIKQQPGFLYRSLGKTEDGIWVDVNYWGEGVKPSELDAIFEKDADCRQFMSMIAQDSMTAQRSEVASTLMGVESAA